MAVLLVVLGASGAQAQESADTLQSARDRHLQRIRAEIRGRESQPAGDVYRNLQILRDLPASRLLAIMDIGFGRSLGVTCEHCHDTGAFHLDVKKPKLIARAMWTMMGRINSELLGSIPELEGRSPTVNCTTCHRGQVTPALNLPER
ncbi:MAG TPA: photosynthetic reaction center cytochrome c subunit family protein [Longimicrobiales bacterium]|nr:photosynthetic reaction center cytochrome c subunit family protein [Longimicrobiales bacterium]